MYRAATTTPASAGRRYQGAGLRDEPLDDDATLDLLSKGAVSHAAAGADLITYLPEDIAGQL